jgi:hypothetical protein
MIRLAVRNEPAWLDLGHGVRVRVRPLTTTLMETARRRAGDELRELREAAQRVRAAHGQVSDLPDLDDPAVAYAETLTRVVKALALYAIREWEGVADDQGEALAATPETIAQLMDIPAFAERFFDRYTETFNATVAEKNG